MSSKDKKVKSSKEDKRQKKTEEVLIVVDRSNAESAASPSKQDGEQNADTGGVNEDPQNHLTSNESNGADAESPKHEDEKPLSDATKLTEILVER